MKTQQSLTVNVDAPTIERLDEHVAKHRPFLKRHMVHKVALNLGLSLLREHPEMLVNYLEGRAQ
jgi:hypothetical protein